MTERKLNIDVHGKEFNRVSVLFLILLSTFAGVLMQTSLGTALPTLMTEFDIDISTAQQATTWFLLANGIMVPLSAYLATRISTRRLHLIAYALLLSGLIVTVMTPADGDMWWMFIIGRVLAAVAVGMMMPLMQIVILSIFPKEKRAVAMGLSGLVIGMAPAIGPTLSGWILDKPHTILGVSFSNSWRNLFTIPIGVLVVALILTPFLMKDIIPTKRAKLDVVSLVLSVFGFGLFLYGFTKVATKGWLDVTNVILPSTIGVLILIVFVLRQLTLEEPFLDVSVFKIKEFTMATILLMLVTMAMFGVEMMLPTYLQNVNGHTPLESGMILLGGALILGIISPISGVLYNKIGVKALALIGFTILIIGSVPFVYLTPTTSQTLIVVMYTVRMAGVGLIMMPVTTFAMSVLSDDRTTHGTAANNTIRQISSSIVVALLTSVTQNVINKNMPSAALQTSNPEAFMTQVREASMSGFRVSFAIGLSFAVLGLIVTFFLKVPKEEA